MMKAASSYGLTTCPAWFCGAIALLFLVGCSGSNASKESDAQPTAETEETVDVGYGTVKKDHLVGSVATIDADDTHVVQPRTLADMLRGRVAGVQVTESPGGGISVRIRGNRSFNSSNEPLYVIDGMVIQVNDGVLYGINPLDIESISVLKDASATATYGSRGSNGVILIKTKRGRN
jgi:TonB-dependent SusC/RagA subfamily outer membrane receptor